MSEQQRKLPRRLDSPVELLRAGYRAGERVFRGLDLRGVDLSEATLDDVKLHEINLSGANLEDAELTGASLIDCDLSGANLRNCNLERARLRRTRLARADLDGTNLDGARLFDMNLRDVDLRCCDLDNARLERVQIDAWRFNPDRRSSTTLVDVSGANFYSMQFFVGTIDALTHERVLRSLDGWSFHSGDSEPYGPIEEGATPLDPEEFPLDVRIRHRFCPPRKKLGQRVFAALRDAPDQVVAGLEALSLSREQLSDLGRACELVHTDFQAPELRAPKPPPSRSDVEFDPDVFDEFDGIYGRWKAEELFRKGIVPPDPEQLSDEMRWFFDELIAVAMSPDELIWQLRHDLKVEWIVAMLRALELPAAQLEQLARACETIVAARLAARAKEAEADE
jgi:uncharacterized protein YjbI with pentapeptide repeats